MAVIRNIWVTGSGGQLGSEFRALASNYPQFTFYFTNSSELSITDADLVHDFMQKHQINILLNCAAYTAVDKAETETETAFAVNGTAPGILASACKEHGALLIHFSTDYVFNGNGQTPYLPSDSTDPVNTYGASKLNGEAEISDVNPEYLIIRTSWLYGTYGNNFVKTMKGLMQTREHLNIVHDQLGSPTNTEDLAQAVMTIISKYPQPQSGIYHYCNQGIISWYQFAEAIKSLSGSTCTLSPITTAEYPTAAKRPAYSVMDTSKISTQFGISIPHWRDSLEKCMKQLG